MAIFLWATTPLGCAAFANTSGIYAGGLLMVYLPKEQISLQE